MITLKNPSAVSEWIINLKEYPQVENALPLNGLNVRNDSNIVAYVSLDGFKVGEVQRYSADTFIGRGFSLIKVYNPDGQDFAPDDIFVQATKGEQVTSQPFNPQWDMMFDDLTRYSTGTDSRMSLKTGVDMGHIKYWLNAQGCVVVQRNLSIQAHATLLGEVSITLGGDNVITVPTGIGVPPPIDLLLHKSNLSDRDFDFSETNAVIIGYIIDYLMNPNDLSSLYVVEQGGATAPNAYDDDMFNQTVTYHCYNNCAKSVWEVSFPPADINALSVRYLGLGGTQAFQYYDGDWHTIVSGSGGVVTQYNGANLGYTGVTKLRMWLTSSGAGSSWVVLFDVSAYE